MKEGLLGGTLSVLPRSELEEARLHVARWIGLESQEARRLSAVVITFLSSLEVGLPLTRRNHAAAGGMREDLRISENHFGAELRRCRKLKGWTQDELADRGASSRAAISRYERGTALPDRHAVDQLDDALEAAGELTAQWVAQLGVSVTLPTKPRRDGSTTTRRRTPASSGCDGPLRKTTPIRPSPSRCAGAAERSATVWHTKGDDGLSIPVILRASTPMLVEFHIGEGPAEAWNLNPGWIYDGRYPVA